MVGIRSFVQSGIDSHNTRGLEKGKRFMQPTYLQNHSLVAADMIRSIPRMEPVADIIRYQEQYFDGSGVPSDGKKGAEIPIGARVLKIALDFDRQLSAVNDQVAAMQEIKKRDGAYDPSIMECAEKALTQIERTRKTFTQKETTISQLTEDMYLALDVITASGVILGSKNQKITNALIITLKNYEKNGQIKEAIHVLSPIG
ncbi:MAG TPA: HD domain-containing phosphohydrolase [Spirochaetota bacterium]|nr:HD domain-containing phosphohydrolase [Spirochaetota bacterium]